MSYGFRDASGVDKSLPAQLTLDHVSPATLLLEKRRQMLEVQQALDAQKEEYARKEEAFKRREDTLRKKDLELQESLIQFNKFLKDKYDKKAKYERMASDEIKQRQLKEREIQQRRASLEQMRTRRDKLKAKWKKYSKYAAFLSAVHEENINEYPEIEYILKRNECLNDATGDLLHRQKDSATEMEHLMKSFQQFNKDQIIESLSANNEIATLQQDLETTEKDGNEQENNMIQKMKTESNQFRKLCKILMAVENLFERVKSSAIILSHAFADHTDGSDPQSLIHTKQPPKKADKLKEEAERLKKMMRQLEQLTKEDLVERRKLAYARLEVIAAYYKDYRDIKAQADRDPTVQEFLRRRKKL